MSRRTKIVHAVMCALMRPQPRDVCTCGAEEAAGVMPTLPAPHASRLDQHVTAVQEAARRGHTHDLHASTTKAPKHLRSRMVARECAACGKDTPHKGLECIYCGTRIIPPPMRRDGKTLSRGQRRAYAIGLRHAHHDRKEAEHRAAERSRQQFEGTK